AVPSTAEGLRALRGVGRYTAGAIASIAFDRAAALVDGNVARVLSRVYGLEGDARSAAGERALRASAERLLPPERPGRHNEALMELGATVCLPREPRCGACPIAPDCTAHLEGRTAELPRVSPRRAPPKVAIVAAVARSGDRVLLARRARKGLFGG